MSVMLVHPPSLFDVKKYDVYPKYSYYEWFHHVAVDFDNYRTLPGEHLGLGSVKAYCTKEREIPVRIIDAPALNHRTVAETWNEIQAVAKRHGPPELIGFTGTSLVFEENLELVQQVKRAWPDARTILGHDFATLNQERLLGDYPEIDFVCRGEGERTFADLAERTLADDSVEGIAGLAYRDADGSVVTEPMGEPLDIDEIPWAVRDYLPNILDMGLAPAVFGTRGCPYRCTFCTTGQTAALWGAKKSYREKSVENLVDEIEFLVRDYDIDFITITDDLFVTKHPASKERARNFAREILRRNIDLDFMIDCRVDSIDRDLFALLKKAGLYRIFVGIETGSSSQLDFYKKRYSPNEEETVRRLQIIQDLGIQMVPGILTFHPTVSNTELWSTLKMIDAAGYTGNYQFTCEVYAFPGTPLYREYEANDWLHGDWPTEGWSFEDPQAERFFHRIVDALGSEEMDFHGLRNEFIRGLEDWDEWTGGDTAVDSTRQASSSLQLQG